MSLASPVSLNGTRRLLQLIRYQRSIDGSWIDCIIAVFNIIYKSCYECKRNCKEIFLHNSLSSKLNNAHWREYNLATIIRKNAERHENPCNFLSMLFIYRRIFWTCIKNRKMNLKLNEMLNIKREMKVMKFCILCACKYFL